MSDQNPTQFENYPTEPGDMGAVTEPGPGASSAPLVVPAPPAQIADWSADTEKSDGTARRVVIGSIVGIVALGFIGSVSRNSGDGESSEVSFTAAAPEETIYEYEEEPESGTPLELGGYAATLPDGWTLDNTSDQLGVATCGTNRVLVRLLDNSGLSATERITGAMKGRLGSFKGSLDEPEDVSFGSTDAARIVGTGKIGKTAARLIGQLWVDADYNSLLVVQTLTAKPDSERALQAQDIADQLSSNFG